MISFKIKSHEYKIVQYKDEFGNVKTAKVPKTMNIIDVNEMKRRANVRYNNFLQRDSLNSSIISDVYSDLYSVETDDILNDILECYVSA